MNPLTPGSLCVGRPMIHSWIVGRPFFCPESRGHGQLLITTCSTRGNFVHVPGVSVTIFGGTVLRSIDVVPDAHRAHGRERCRDC